MRSRSRTALALALLLACAAPLFAPQLARGAPEAVRALWRTLAVQLWFSALAVAIALQLGGSLRERLGLARSGRPLAPRVRALICALGVLGVLALSGALAFGVQALALEPGTSLARLDSIAAAAASQHPWLLLAAFGLAPGIGEELLLRGALQRSLARTIGAWCVPAAALAFAALHMDLVQSPAAFVLGCYLGALAWLRRSSWLAIAAHIANDALIVLAQIFPAAGAALPRPGSWGEAALWACAAGLCLAWIARSSSSQAGADRNASG